jgi:tetratricopeptide (TPR) repeat protein
MIVRDEERFLEGCLHSLIGCVDDLVVVDTGSTDRSRAIAQDAGARVLDYPWADDFAAARNAAIDAARGDWILYIDADERAIDFDRAELDVLLADPRHAALTVLFRPLSGHTRYREHRLFRNRPELRFRGVIHESIVPALGELCTREKLLIGHSAVSLDHLGYDGDLRKKHERNLPLLRARLAIDPEHVYSWAHLGETLLALGDEEQAEQAWRRGVDVARGRRHKQSADSLPHLHLAAFLLDRKRDADALLGEGCRWYPDNHALAWLRARRLVDAGHYAEAMPIFARLAAIDPDRLVEGSMAFDASIFGANAYAALGLCAFRLNRFEESAACYAQAEALAPDNLEFRTKRGLAQAKATAR